MSLSFLSIEIGSMLTEKNLIVNQLGHSLIKTDFDIHKLVFGALYGTSGMKKKPVFYTVFTEDLLFSIFCLGRPKYH